MLPLSTGARSWFRSAFTPEAALKKIFTHQGLQPQYNVMPIAGLRREVDILFDAHQVAVFVDGCFWHGCPKHSRPTKSNTKWWADKIETNRKRDRSTTRMLRQRGYAVLRVWEHEDPERAVERIARCLVRKPSL